MTQAPSPINSVAPLANVAALVQLIERCQNRAFGLPGMGCLHGPAGRGKTTAAIYAINRFNACHVEALPFGGVKGLLALIVTELGIRPGRTTDVLFGQVAKELAESDRPLIIDEADSVLADKTIETIRRLHDVAGVPVILVGEEMLPQKLMRWERVHSRILSWAPVEAATAQDVDHLARIYARGLTLAPDLKAAILTASRGSIRNVSTNLAFLSEHAARMGLTSLSLADWGARPFHTGEAPTPRLVAQAGILKRRGAA